eukprot:3675679-Rhodomonas_salina.2
MIWTRSVPYTLQLTACDDDIATAYTLNPSTTGVFDAMDAACLGGAALSVIWEQPIPKTLQLTARVCDLGQPVWAGQSSGQSFTTDSFRRIAPGHLSLAGPGRFPQPYTPNRQTLNPNRQTLTPKQTTQIFPNPHPESPNPHPLNPKPQSSCLAFSEKHSWCPVLTQHDAFPLRTGAGVFDVYAEKPLFQRRTGSEVNLFQRVASPKRKTRNHLFRTRSSVSCM